MMQIPFYRCELNASPVIGGPACVVIEEGIDVAAIQQTLSVLTRWARTGMFRAGARGDDPPVIHDRLLTWANGVTMIRLSALPVFVVVTINNAFGGAFVLLWALALMDCVDGYLARRLNQVSRLGMILDPIADRVTVATVGITLAAIEVMPWWIAAVILARDALLFVSVVTLFRDRLSIKVTRVGKISTLSLLFGVPGFLIRGGNFPGSSALEVVTATLTVVGVILYYVSLAQYVGRGVRLRLGRSLR